MKFFLPFFFILFVPIDADSQGYEELDAFGSILGSVDAIRVSSNGGKAIMSSKLIDLDFNLGDFPWQGFGRDFQRCYIQNKRSKHVDCPFFGWVCVVNQV